MKQNKSVKGLAIFLSVIMLSSGICSLTAFAGTNNTVIDKNSFAETINADLWNNPEEDVYVENGALIFPEDGTEETRLITVASAQANSRLDELFHASVTMQLTHLPKNEKFVFAFGLQRAEAYQGNKGNVEIAFSNQGGLKVEVTAYGDDGKAVSVVDPIACGSMNSNISIEAKLRSGGKLTLKVAGKTLCNNEKLPVSGEGKLGFLQTGGCGAKVSNVNFIIHKYDAPQNTNIEENFDTGAMNTAVFSSKTVWSSDYYPQSLSVQEYDGNDVLMFERTALAYIGTRHAYSNFEMTFDVPYFQRKDIRDENGELIEPATTNFLLSFGGDAIDHSLYGYTEAADCIVFHSNSSVSNYAMTHVDTDEKHLIFDDKYDSDNGFSVKLSVIDAVVTVALKWLNEKTYSTVLTYTLESGTPTGYIHLWTNTLGNFAVDNIKIINKDKEPDLLTIDATYDSFERVADFVEEEEELVFREDATETNQAQGEDFQWYSLIVYAAIAGVVILAGGFVTGQILKGRSSKKTGGKQDEA